MAAAQPQFLLNENANAAYVDYLKNQQLQGNIGLGLQGAGLAMGVYDTFFNKQAAANRRAQTNALEAQAENLQEQKKQLIEERENRKQMRSNLGKYFGGGSQ